MSALVMFLKGIFRHLKEGSKQVNAKGKKTKNKKQNGPSKTGQEIKSLL